MLREAVGLFFSIGVILAALLACGDPAWSMTGTVVDGTGAPIPGATVKVLCPGKAVPWEVQTTNDAGDEPAGVGTGDGRAARPRSTPQTRKSRTRARRAPESCSPRGGPVSSR